MTGGAPGTAPGAAPAGAVRVAGPRWRRAALCLAGGAGLAALALAGGFLLFVLHAAAAVEAEISPAPPSDPAAGIAVLTGGPERVETGLALLLARPGERLIVSGVAAEAALPDLARLAGLDPAALEPRTALGHEATSTRGNAREVAAWARAGGIREITVVTAGFHMPRALLELRRAMPEVALRPHPVFPTLARPLPMLREYLKLVGAGLGLSALTERPRRALP